MKIITDSTWGKIYDENQNVLLSLDRYAYALVIRNVLNNSQQMRHQHSDGVYKLSKKAEIYLLQYKALNETINNHPKNEGQVKYLVRKERLFREIDILTEIINDFSLTKKPNQ